MENETEKITAAHTVSVSSPVCCDTAYLNFTRSRGFAIRACKLSKPT